MLAGVQAADDRDGQLGPAVAALLNVPCVEVVTRVAAAAGHVTVHKEYSGGIVAELEVDTPRDAGAATDPILDFQTIVTDGAGLQRSRSCHLYRFPCWAAYSL